MRPFHTYQQVDVPGRDQLRFVIYRWSHIPDDDRYGKREVWSTGVASYSDRNEIGRKRRQVFEECCRRNGAKPRKASWREAIGLMAQLRELDRQGVRE